MRVKTTTKRYSSASRMGGVVSSGDPIPPIEQPRGPILPREDPSDESEESGGFQRSEALARLQARRLGEAGPSGRELANDSSYWPTYPEMRRLKVTRMGKDYFPFFATNEVMDAEDLPPASLTGAGGKFLLRIRKDNHIPPDFGLRLPGEGENLMGSPDGWVAIPVHSFDSGLRLPPIPLHWEIMARNNLAPGQLSPAVFRYSTAFASRCVSLGFDPSYALFQRFFQFSLARKGSNVVTLAPRSGLKGMFSSKNKFEGWNKEFVLVHPPAKWTWQRSWTTPHTSSYNKPTRALTQDEEKAVEELSKEVHLNAEEFIGRSILLARGLVPGVRSSYFTVVDPRAMREPEG